MMIGKKKYQAVTFFSVFLTVLLLVICASPASSDTVNGVHVIEFKLREGVVKLYLPDDIAAGDTISASIGVFPEGTSSEERFSNTSVLNGYIIENSYISVPVGQKTFKMNIPKNTAGSTIKFALKDGHMRELSNSRIQIGLSAPVSGGGEVPTPFDYHCPLVGQAGRFVEIRGPFDGDFATTDFQIGSKKPYVLAESPRKLVFETPPDIVGSVDLVLKEREVVVKRPFTCLQVVKIGEEGAVPVGRFDRERPQVAARPTAKRQASSSSPTVQRLEFESIKAEETLSSPDTTGTAAVSESASENSEKKLIIARQMASPFHRNAVSGDKPLVTENERPASPRETGKTGKIEDESAELAVKPNDESHESQDHDSSLSQASSIKNGKDGDSPSYGGREAKGLIVEAQLVASFTAVDTEVGREMRSPTIDKGNFAVQVASFKKEKDAQILAEKLSRKGYPVFVVPADIPGRGRWYRVRVGSFGTRKEASLYGNNLRRKEPLVNSFFTAENN